MTIKATGENFKASIYIYIWNEGQNYQHEHPSKHHHKKHLLLHKFKKEQIIFVIVSQYIRLKTCIPIPRLAPVIQTTWKEQLNILFQVQK